MDNPYDIPLMDSHLHSEKGGRSTAVSSTSARCWPQRTTPLHDRKAQAIDRNLMQPSTPPAVNTVLAALY